MSSSNSQPQRQIRIGIVGLSASPLTWGQRAHYPYLARSPHYTIVALCNSSIKAAQAAIATYKLDPATTKAYDSYSDLAADPNVDLYVITTRADSHYEAALPALKAGKDIYCEWPLAANTTQAREMVELARQHNCRTIVGLQGRVSPTVRHIRTLINSGRLGAIHSVNFHGAINVWQDNAAGHKYYYFMDKSVGGNLMTIYGGHCIDSLLHAVDAELVPGAYRPLIANLRPQMWRTGPDGQILKDEGLYPKDTPDQILLQGRLDRDPKAVLSFHIRAGARFKDEPGSQWRIYGTKGELVVEFASTGPQIGGPTALRFSNSETDQVEDLLAEVDEGGEEWTSLPIQGQNIGRLFEAFAVGDTTDFADWEWALKRHELLDEFWESGM